MRRRRKRQVFTAAHTSSNQYYTSECLILLDVPLQVNSKSHLSRNPSESGASSLQQRMRSIGFVAFAVFYFNWEIQAGMFRDYQFNLQLIDSEAARVSTSNDDQALQLTDDPEDREEEGEQSFHIHRKLYI